MKDVAREAGVGLMTVSRVINGIGEKRVGEATAARVREIVARLGYEPNDIARRLRGRKSGVIGLVIIDIANPFWAQCARGVELEARKHGYVTMLVVSDENAELEEKRIAVLRQKKVEGLLLIPAACSLRSPSERPHGLPTVVLDRPLPSSKADTVLVHNRAAARKITEHLIEHGHRRIAFVGYGRYIYAVSKRVQGYKQAMEAAGLEASVHVQAPDASYARATTLQLLSELRPPTAIFALNSVVLLGVMQGASEKQLAIPHDLAVAGFEDFEWASFVKPSLTLVRHPGEQMGKLAAQFLFDRLSGSWTGGPRRVMVNAELITRESCGCKPR